MFSLINENDIERLISIVKKFFIVYVKLSITLFIIEQDSLISLSEIFKGGAILKLSGHRQKPET